MEPNEVTPDELKSARYQLGMTQEQLARALELGKDGKRAVRRWEKNERPISGPVAVAIRFMLAAKSGSLTHARRRKDMPDD